MVDDAFPFDSGGAASAEPLVIYGCGTQGRAIIELVRESGRYPNILLTDDDRRLWGSDVFFLPVRSPAQTFGEGPRRFLCAIGENRVRQSITRCLTADGHQPYFVRHGSAIVAGSACLGEGSILMARVVVNTEARVGPGCLLNTGCVVEHHCEIGSFVHLAPGVILGGCVRVGDRAMLGLGAVVLPGLSIGHEATVGAGAVVIRDVPPGTVVAGNPAKPIVRVTPSLLPSSPLS